MKKQSNNLKCQRFQTKNFTKEQKHHYLMHQSHICKKRSFEQIDS